jgi:hypothetical protein
MQAASRLKRTIHERPGFVKGFVLIDQGNGQQFVRIDQGTTKGWGVRASAWQL